MQANIEKSEDKGRVTTKEFVEFKKILNLKLLIQIVKLSLRNVDESRIKILFPLMFSYVTCAKTTSKLKEI